MPPALAAALSAKPAAQRVLDYGSGVGNLLPILAAHYPEAGLAAADIMDKPEGLPVGVQWHRGDLNQELPIPDASFDLIFAVEVIEHLENPRHVLREIFRLLEPGGVAILTTPNTRSIRSLLTFVMRGHFAAFDDFNYPAHITPMTTLDFERAGMEAGFPSPQIFYTDLGNIPKFLRVKWQSLPVFGKFLKGRRYSDNFGTIYVKSKGDPDGPW